MVAGRRYEWFRTAGACTRLTAFKIDPTVLDMDREELVMLMELTNKAVDADTYTLPDFITFCFTKEHTAQKLCDGIVAWVEQAFMVEENFLKCVGMAVWTHAWVGVVCCVCEAEQCRHQHSVPWRLLSLSCLCVDPQGCVRSAVRACC